MSHNVFRCYGIIPSLLKDGHRPTLSLHKRYSSGIVWQEQEACWKAEGRNSGPASIEQESGLESEVMIEHVSARLKLTTICKMTSLKAKQSGFRPVTTSPIWFGLLGG